MYHQPSIDQALSRYCISLHLHFNCLFISVPNLPLPCIPIKNKYMKLAEMSQISVILDIIVLTSFK